MEQRTWNRMAQLLQLISTIQPGETLCLIDYTKVDHNTWYSYIKRRYNAENRERLLDAIEDAMLVSLHYPHDSMDFATKLHTELQIGLTNLAKTYEEDASIVSRIQQVIECNASFISMLHTDLKICTSLDKEFENAATQTEIPPSTNKEKALCCVLEEVDSHLDEAGSSVNTTDNDTTICKVTTTKQSEDANGGSGYPLVLMLINQAVHLHKKKLRLTSDQPRQYTD